MIYKFNIYIILLFNILKYENKYILFDVKYNIN